MFGPKVILLWCHPLKGRGQEKKLPPSKNCHFFESPFLADRFLTAPVISRVYYVSCAAPVTHQDLGRSGFESCKTASIRKALSAFSGPENLRFHTVFNLQTAWLGYQPFVTHGMGSKKNKQLIYAERGGCQSNLMDFSSNPTLGSPPRSDLMKIV